MLTTTQHHTHHYIHTMSETKRVLISGAGPAGILCAIQLLRRNIPILQGVQYHVTLVDAGRDYGTLTAEELPSHRSWMIGLSTHGLTAIRQVPDLFQDYVADIGVELDSVSVFLGASEMKTKADPCTERISLWIETMSCRVWRGI